MLRQLSLFLFFFLFLLRAHAESKVFLWPYFPGFRLERNEDQELETRTTYSTGVGILMDQWFGSLETARFESSTSEGNTSIQRTYQDLSLWGGYGLHHIEAWHIIGQVGLGLFKEQVKTRVAALTDSDTSEEKSLFGIGLEALYSDSVKIWTVSVGGRFFWGESLDPNPQPTLHLKLGFQF